jgi:hypothetical protein
VAPRDCEQVTGGSLRPLFGRALDPEQLESSILQLHQLSPADLQRRQERDDLLCFDWRKGGVWYTAGLRNNALLFVNLRFEPGEVTAGQVVACLGSPDWYQAWYDAFLGLGVGSLQLALAFPAHTLMAYCARHFTPAPEQTPAVDDGMAITMIGVFGEHRAENERPFSKAQPWPGDWQDVQVELIEHRGFPVASERDQKADALPSTATDEVLAEIKKAFADAPRPTDDELLHPDAHDDSDIQALMGVPHWRDLPDQSVEHEYAALAFLSPTGFRHFLPAYMSWVLRHPEVGAAVGSSTILALTPASEGPMRGFMLSKYSLLDDGQRAAVVSFLRVMANFEDVAAALDYWDPRATAAGPAAATAG